MSDFFYRGTSRNWPGSQALQLLNLTPISTDPLVATLFAVESARFGEGVVYMCRRSAVAELIAPGNVLSELERELVVGVSPKEFAERFVTATVDAQYARTVLAEMGCELPAQIADKNVLDWHLRTSARLREQDLTIFDARVLGS
jgi:hypothetical protein